jgi:hypothetical protein
MKKTLGIGFLLGIAFVVAGQEAASYQTAGRIIDCAGDPFCFMFSEPTALEEIFKQRHDLGRWRLEQYLKSLEGAE